MADGVGELVRSAFIAGHLSKGSIAALKNREVAQQLAGGLRRHDVRDADVLLVTAVIDDSGSIAEAHQEPAIREGHNRLLALLRDAASDTHIFVTTRFLNGTIVNPFADIRTALELTPANYNSALFGGTPLYHQAVITLGTLLLQTQTLEDVGCRVRTITLIMSDGLDESQYVGPGSSYQARYTTPASDVAFIAGDMQSSGNHLLAAYAVGTGSTLESEFIKMGIKPGWILKSPDALQSLLTFATAAVQASLSPSSFQKLLARGGFAAS